MIPGGVREYKLATRLECDVPTVIPARGMAFLSPNRVVLGVGVYNQKWRGVYRTVMLLPLLLCSLHVPECAGMPEEHRIPSPHTGHHESPWPPCGPLAVAEADFLAAAGSRYGYHDNWLDSNYWRELGSRLGSGQHYIDYTGAALYTSSHLQAATQLLQQLSLGNPHSKSPSSERTSRRVEAARQLVLEWFGADPKDYVVVWTKGATQALKIVGEMFPWSPSPRWQPGRRVSPGGGDDQEAGRVSDCGHVPVKELSGEASTFVYLRANHKSVLGIGAYAKQHGAQVACVHERGMAAWLAEPPAMPTVVGGRDHQPLQGPSVHASAARALLMEHESRGLSAAGAGAAGEEAKHSPLTHDKPITYSLVAYPSKDNFAGRLYPLDWVKQVQSRSTSDHKWLVVLDAAAYVPTHALNLTEVPADFVAVSFYKMFGYPTGLGALVMRRDAAALLHKTYFGGGSVYGATAEDVWRVLLEPPERFEDGTIDFLGICQLQFGLQQLRSMGGMEAIAQHVETLRNWTYTMLVRLQYSNNQPLVHLFGKHAAGPAMQSALFEFLVLRPDGSALSPAEVEQEAGQAGLHLRAGCHCNPGECFHAVGLSPEEVRQATLAGHALDPYLIVQRPAGEPLPSWASVINSSVKSHGVASDGSHFTAGAKVTVRLPNGSVRASLGYMSRFEDVYALVDWLYKRYVLQHAFVSMHSLQ